VRRWWIGLALLLSLGINLGLLGAIAAGRWAGRGGEAEAPPAAEPAGGRELPGGFAVEVPEAGSEAGPSPRRLRERAARRGLDGPPVGRLADHLGLEGERRARFVELQRRFVESHLEARRERFRLGAELRRELVAERPDRERVEELLAALAAAHEEDERATAEVILASRQLLDEEQRRAYFRFLERLRGGRGERRGPGGRGPR
jgi:hypothetical protein